MRASHFIGCATTGGVGELREIQLGGGYVKDEDFLLCTAETQSEK